MYKNSIFVIITKTNFNHKISNESEFFSHLIPYIFYTNEIKNHMYLTDYQNLRKKRVIQFLEPDIVIIYTKMQH